jgi:hypothetical protein
VSDRVEVECELPLFDHYVSDVPLQLARDRRCVCAILGREPREQRNALEIDLLHLIPL